MVVVLVSPIGPVMALQIVPEVFNRVEFGRIGWQLDQRHVRWHLEMLGAMEAGAIPNHDRMLIVCQGL